MSDTMTISLEIENTYDDGTEITTYATDVVMPVPPDDVDGDDYHDWAFEHVFNLTGTGHTSGDSWYDVTVTACSVPALVGRTFEFGY